MGKFLSDFKEFAMKGNVVDMAVGVIVGGAFGKIVSSLVNDVLMPVIGLFTGGMDFSDMKYVMQEAVMNGEEVITPEVAIGYGQFIQYIIDFIIVAFSIFVAIRFLMKFKKKEEAAEEAPAPAPEPTKEEVLLTEIRDLLRQQSDKK